MIRLLRLLRRDPFALKALSTLNVIEDLESCGCQVLAAAVLPSPAVRVDRQPRVLPPGVTDAPYPGPLLIPWSTSPPSTACVSPGRPCRVPLTGCGGSGHEPA